MKNRPLAGLLIGACAWFSACDPNVSSPKPAPRGEVPTVLTPVPGHAVLAGRVIDLAGHPVAGATVTVAEIDKQVTVANDGIFQFHVPADSTLSLRASAAGFATTYRASLQLPAEKTVSNLSLYLVPPAKLEELNRGTPMPGGRGVVAVELRSRDGRCQPVGSEVRLTPPGLGTVIYTDNGSNEPDPTLGVAAAEDGISAWVIGALPAGGASLMHAHKDGCADVAFPVDLGDRVHTGKFRIAPGALTQIVLFVE